MKNENSANASTSCITNMNKKLKTEAVKDYILLGRERDMSTPFYASPSSQPVAEIKDSPETNNNKPDNKMTVGLNSVLDMFGRFNINQKTSKEYTLEQCKSTVQKDILNAEWFLQDTEFDKLYKETEIPSKKEIIEPLTKQEAELVNKVLKPGQHGSLSQFKTASVEYKDIYKLKPQTWLNDEIINFYFELLSDRASKNPSFPSIYCFNTFFCSTLREQGYTKVRRWTKRVDIYSKDILFVPINKSYHWVLGVINMKSKTISVYDSLYGNHRETLDILLDYLQEEHLDKKKTPYDIKGWKTESPNDTPGQENAYDCGVFTCTFAERISRRAPIDFSQTDMDLIRRRMIVNIFNKEI